MTILKETLEAVYAERNQCVVALAKMALRVGLTAGVAQQDPNEEWDPDWRNIIFIDLPTGQVSWHMHDSESHLFTALPRYMGKWDRHSTQVKYERLAALPVTIVKEGVTG